MLKPSIVTTSEHQKKIVHKKMYKMYDINNEQQKEWDSSHLTPTTKKTHHVIIPTVVLVHLTRK